MPVNPALAVVVLALFPGTSGFLEASAPDPVARVGERAISRAMLEDAVSQALNASYHHGQITGDRRRELERVKIDELIRRELNLAGALDRGLEPPLAEAEASRAGIEVRLGTAAYEEALASVGMTREDHTRTIAETLLAQRAYDEFVLRPAEVGDNEVREAFGASPDHWKMPESSHVLHILLTVRPDADATATAGVERQVAELADRARGGEDFRGLAAEFSQDMYRIKGGDLGWVHRGRLVAELEEPVWAADIGGVVGPVRSSEGYHLAKVLGRRPARPMEWPEVEPLLRERLETSKLEVTEEAWFGPLRRAHPVVILDPDLAPEME